MSADERLARELQRQFDAEERLRRAEEAASERLAQRLAASSHSMSDSDGDSDDGGGDALWPDVAEDVEDEAAARLAEAAVGTAEDGWSARGGTERRERGPVAGKRRHSPSVTGGGPTHRGVPRDDGGAAVSGKRLKLPGSITSTSPASRSPARTVGTPSTTSRSPGTAGRTASPRTADVGRTGPASQREVGGKPGTDSAALRTAGADRPAPQRDAASGGGNSRSESSRECPYGARCYRQGNPAHTAAFSHPEKSAQRPRPAGLFESPVSPSRIVLRSEHTMRTKCAISDAFVRLGRTRPILRTLYA